VHTEKSHDEVIFRIIDYLLGILTKIKMKKSQLLNLMGQNKTRKILDIPQREHRQLHRGIH
jgi:hypothetical protein